MTKHLASTAPTKDVKKIKAANYGNDLWEEKECEVVRIHKTPTR